MRVAGREALKAAKEPTAATRPRRETARALRKRADKARAAKETAVVKEVMRIGARGRVAKEINDE
jgi:hypothetical protein